MFHYFNQGECEIKIQFVELPEKSSGKRRGKYLPKPEMLEVLTKNKGKWAILREFTTKEGQRKCRSSVTAWKYNSKSSVEIAQRIVNGKYVVYIRAV